MTPKLRPVRIAAAFVGVLTFTVTQASDLPPPNAENNVYFGNVHVHTSWSFDGLAGVWAPENTREAIWDAMKREETFATSGPMINFGSFDYTADDVQHPDFLKRAYAAGVPMGAT